MEHIGRNEKKAIIYAVEQFNKNLGNMFAYQLAIEDDQLQPAKTAMALRKLISYDKISVVITSFSGPAQVVKPVAAQEKIIHFTVAISDRISDGKYTFNYFPGPSAVVSKKMDFIKKKEAQNIALVLTNNAASQELLGSLEPALKKNGIMYTEYLFGIGERDFKIMMGKVKNAHHDLIIVNAYLPEIALIYKEIKNQNIQTPVLGVFAFENGNFNPDLFDGWYEVSALDNQAWAESIGLDSSYVADNVYDAVNIFMQTYERAGKNSDRVPTADEFREELYKVREYDGISGPSSLEDSGQFHLEGYLKKIVGGKLQSIELEDL